LVADDDGHRDKSGEREEEKRKKKKNERKDGTSASTGVKRMAYPVPLMEIFF
jgi:hypothetical protein